MIHQYGVITVRNIKQKVKKKVNQVSAQQVKRINIKESCQKSCKAICGKEFNRDD